MAVQPEIRPLYETPSRQAIPTLLLILKLFMKEKAGYYMFNTPLNHEFKFKFV